MTDYERGVTTTVGLINGGTAMKHRAAALPLLHRSARRHRG